jgi:signal transduction protein with GAF and PtsI domain
MSTPDMSAEVEAATQRVRELGEQVAEQARKNGLAWLEGYETVLKNFLDLQEQVAKGSGAEWASTLATTQANFVRSTSEVVLGAWRQQLKGN